MLNRRNFSPLESQTWCCTDNTDSNFFSFLKSHSSNTFRDGEHYMLGRGEEENDAFTRRFTLRVTCSTPEPFAFI